MKNINVRVIRVTRSLFSEEITRPVSNLIGWILWFVWYSAPGALSPGRATTFYFVQRKCLEVATLRRFPDRPSLAFFFSSWFALDIFPWVNAKLNTETKSRSWTKERERDGNFHRAVEHGCNTALYNISNRGKEARSMLDKLPLNGKKTYIVAALTLMYFVSGLLIGEIPTNDAMMGIAAALGITTIGHKIDKSVSNWWVVFYESSQPFWNCCFSGLRKNTAT